MSKVKNQAAYDAFIKARTILVVTQPFFGCLSLHLNLVEEEDEKIVPTMAVDGFTIWYNPKFVLSLKEKELQGVIAHEILHCVYRHMIRRGHRHPIIFNYAGDYRINYDLKEAGLTLPGNPVPWSNPPSKAQGHLYDKQFANNSTEEIYEKIKKDCSKGKGNGEEIIIQLGGDPGGCGGVRDAGKPGDADSVELTNAEWEALTRLAVNVAKRANAGKLPGYLERVVDNLQQSKVNWRDLTRQFIDGAMIKDYSWARPNRRFAGMGITLPGFVPDALHKLVMCVDCSGSITKEMLHEYVSEIAGALDEGIADSIIVVYVDTDVRHVDEYNQGDVVKAKVVAGGGTDFKTTFEWIKKNHSDASVITFLTDMMTGSFGEDIGVPTLWCAYTDRATLNHYKPPHGFVIPVSTD